MGTRVPKWGPIWEQWFYMFFFCRTSLESHTTSSKMRCLHCRFSLGLVWVWPWGGFWICFNRPQRCTWGYQPNFFWKSVFEEHPTTHNMFLTPHSEQILIHQVLYQKPIFVPTKVVHPIFFSWGGAVNPYFVLLFSNLYGVSVRKGFKTPSHGKSPLRGYPPPGPPRTRFFRKVSVKT